jgi:hypothetical protein
MKWGHNWRKLYRQPSQEWLSLPLSTRGLGDEMIRVAADDGTIYIGEDPVSGLCRAVDAQPLERRRVKADLDLLLQDGFCSIDGKYIRIRNLQVAQGSVSPSGERMRKLRAKQTSDKPQTNLEQTHDKPTTNVEQTIDVTPRKDSTEPVTVTVEENRIEENREEASQPSAAPAPPPKGKPKPDPTVDELNVFEHWQRGLKHPNAKLDAKRLGKIRSALKSHGLETCLKAINGVASSQWHRENKQDDIELILRDASHIEKYSRLVDGTQAPTLFSIAQPANVHPSHVDGLSKLHRPARQFSSDPVERARQIADLKAKIGVAS